MRQRMSGKDDRYVAELLPLCDRHRIPIQEVTSGNSELLQREFHEHSEPAHGAISAVVRWARPDRDRSAGARPRNSPTARLFFSLERSHSPVPALPSHNRQGEWFMDEDRIKG